MCDYSLHGVASRPAKVGDRLITSCFWNTGTRGFCAIGEPNVAVCLLPGTEVAFETEVRRRLGWRRLGWRLAFWKTNKSKLGHTLARFRQIDMDNPRTHHDALEFPDGETMLLTHLRLGQRARVLQLPVQADAPVVVEQAPAIWPVDARPTEAPNVR